MFTLAIQPSDHPPTLWMTTQVREDLPLLPSLPSSCSASLPPSFPPSPLSPSQSHPVSLPLSQCVYYLLTQCSKGDRLSVQVGGDFIYHPTETRLHDLLLIGGGVGINPLISMCLHHVRLVELSRNTRRVKLLYSARNAAELLFKVVC